MAWAACRDLLPSARAEARMTIFLWTVVILMAAALLAEIFAFVGMALVAVRAARRTGEIAEQIQQKIAPTVELAKELQESLQARAETIRCDGQEIAALITTRSESMWAAVEDTRRRAERIQLRWMEGVQSVEGKNPTRRGIYREVVEPLQAASQVVRGLKLALWILRRVA
jgi:hypothetical protein